MPGLYTSLSEHAELDELAQGGIDLEARAPRFPSSLEARVHALERKATVARVKSEFGRRSCVFSRRDLVCCFCGLVLGVTIMAAVMAVLLHSNITEPGKRALCSQANQTDVPTAMPASPTALPAGRISPCLAINLTLDLLVRGSLGEYVGGQFYANPLFDVCTLQARCMYDHSCVQTSTDATTVPTA